MLTILSGAGLIRTLRSWPDMEALEQLHLFLDDKEIKLRPAEFITKTLNGVISHIITKKMTESFCCIVPNAPVPLKDAPADAPKSSHFITIVGICSDDEKVVFVVEPAEKNHCDWALSHMRQQLSANSSGVKLFYVKLNQQPPSDKNSCGYRALFIYRHFSTGISGLNPRTARELICSLQTNFHRVRCSNYQPSFQLSCNTHLRLSLSVVVLSSHIVTYLSY